MALNHEAEMLYPATTRLGAGSCIFRSLPAWMVVWRVHNGLNGSANSHLPWWGLDFCTSSFAWWMAPGTNRPSPCRSCGDWRWFWCLRSSRQPSASGSGTGEG